MNQAKWNAAEGEMLLVAAKMAGFLSVAATDDNAPRYIATRAAALVDEYRKHAGARMESINEQ